jgi:hypothetical protein
LKVVLTLPTSSARAEMSGNRMRPIRARLFAVMMSPPGWATVPVCGQRAAKMEMIAPAWKNIRVNLILRLPLPMTIRCSAARLESRFEKHFNGNLLSPGSCYDGDWVI